ncbi:MAG: hypothetical protein A2798_01975 [Candidatus Levybacteria bacterium RIFCSPHIGHO2_01_FULL_37_17]|nr:MAG: hypothetical protein A2798_01975 [Candidatus Levybacteria bacterium RIFCSPHIGHO2_01_FULL_37_17]
MKTKNYKDFINSKQTAYPSWNRLKIFGEEYHFYKERNKKSLKILDIGCGKEVYLRKFYLPGDKYYACDFYDKPNIKVENYKKIDLNEDKLDEVYKNQKFDVIFCGEVIEHLFSPDDLLKEIRLLMHKDSILILSTPNLGYYINRIMLLFGISPLFLENSSYYKLGRRFSFFGQRNITEGHIRVFTYGALLDLLKLKKYKIIKIRSVSVWNFWPDRIVTRFFKSLASDNIFILKK